MGNKVAVEYAAHGIIGRRPTMEDAEATITNYGGKATQAFFGIFDGHVGPNCSKFVAAQLPKILLKEPAFATDTKDALTNACFKVDKEWLAKAKAANPVMKDGSTGVVVVLRDQKIYCANTGDSRSVMYQGGKVVPLSFDQKPEHPEEQRRIEKAGGVVLMGRVQGEIAVARSFGDISMKNAETLEPKFLTPEPDVREFDLTEDTQFIILACDGLWDKLSNEDAVEFVRKKLDSGANLKSSAEALCQEAFQKGSQDNISAIIVQFKAFKAGSSSNPSSPVLTNNNNASPPPPAAEPKKKKSPKPEEGER